MNTFAFRFDVDSVRCVECIPALRRLADRLNVRFTFMVNMGRSWSWRYRKDGVKRAGSALSATEKLGTLGILKTLALNPQLGIRYADTFAALQADGHELGLHGGMNHAEWQYGLDRLPYHRLRASFVQANDEFWSRFGKPTGFASPGFKTNHYIAKLLDEHRFRYASDAVGETPFRSMGVWQVPVNVVGKGRVPVIEQGLAEGYNVHEVFAIKTRRRWALAYDHPFVAGAYPSLLETVLRCIRDTHDIVTVGEYLDRWEAEEAQCLAS